MPRIPFKIIPKVPDTHEAMVKAAMQKALQRHLPTQSRVASTVASEEPISRRDFFRRGAGLRKEALQDQRDTVGRAYMDEHEAGYERWLERDADYNGPLEDLDEEDLAFVIAQRERDGVGAGVIERLAQMDNELYARVNEPSILQKLMAFKKTLLGGQ